MPTQSISYQIPNHIPSYREILARDVKGDVHKGKLWDRSEFFFQFPFHLLAIGELLEHPNGKMTKHSLHKPVLPILSSKDSQVIQQMLYSKDSGRRAIALEMSETQSVSGDKTQNIEIALFDKDPYVRIVGIHLLTQNRSKEMIPMLLKAVQDSNEFVRIEALRCLSNDASDATRLVFYSSIKDPSPLVRGEIAKILGKIRHRDSIHYLKKLSNDGEEYVRTQALEALDMIENNSIK